MVNSVIPEVLNRPSKDIVIKLNDGCLGGLLGGDMTQLTLPYRLDVQRFATIKVNVDGYNLKLFILDYGGKFFTDLTLRDAFQSGYNNLESFKLMLRDRYDCNKTSPLWWYKFKVI